MRVGFFTDCYLPSGFGVETSIETFRKTLEQMGHSVFVFAPYFPGYKDENPNVFRFRSVRVIKKPPMHLAFPFLPLNGLKQRVDLPLDIVHSQTPFGMGLLGKYVSYHQKIPLLYTHHTHYPEYVKVYFKEKLVLPKLAEFLVKWYSDMCNGVIAPSLKIKRLLQKYGVKKQIFVLPTGINLEFFRKKPGLRERIRKQLTIKASQKVLLFVGRMGKEKNLDFLIKALAEIVKIIPQARLVMVGDGPYLPFLKELALNLGLAENTIFTGSVSYPEIPGYYQAADVFLFASLTDTQGLVILEAIASGLPVVALKDEAFSQMVLAHKNGFLIKKASPRDFAQKVIKLLENPVLWKNFSKQSQRIAQGLSKENQTKRLLQIYRKWVGKAPLICRSM